MTTSALTNVPKIMVFRPTYEEFKDFNSYIAHMESVGAHKAGLAKIIPPKEWVPHRGGYDDIDMIIPAPIKQIVHGRQGLFQQINLQQKALTVREFKRLAESITYCTPQHTDYDDLERRYWKNITYVPPMYGADVSGTLYDDDVEIWNINRLNTILDCVNSDYGIQIEGVNTAYLYFGMWKTTFAWHTEDMDLYSINYLHFGEPKSWYAIPPEHGRRLERLASGFFPSNFTSCSAFLRHKMTLISPQTLRQYSIPYNKITQEAGEFMVTFPYGYHAGFNHGFNCAESTNFATPRWVEYGKRALQCTCRNDSVKISMDTFVKRFQPDRYESWLEGKDIGPHPEDPSRITAAPPPNKSSIFSKKGRKKSEEGLISKRHPISDIDGKECTKLEETKENPLVDDHDYLGIETKKKKKSKLVEGDDQTKSKNTKKRLKKEIMTDECVNNQPTVLLSTSLLKPATNFQDAFCGFVKQETERNNTKSTISLTVKRLEDRLKGGKTSTTTANEGSSSRVPSNSPFPMLSGHFMKQTQAQTPQRRVEADIQSFMQQNKQLCVRGKQRMTSPRPQIPRPDSSPVLRQQLLNPPRQQMIVLPDVRAMQTNNNNTQQMCFNNNNNDKVQMHGINPTLQQQQHHQQQRLLSMQQQQYQNVTMLQCQYQPQQRPMGISQIMIRQNYDLPPTSTQNPSMINHMNSSSLPVFSGQRIKQEEALYNVFPSHIKQQQAFTYGNSYPLTHQNFPPTLEDHRSYPNQMNTDSLAAPPDLGPPQVVSSYTDLSHPTTSSQYVYNGEINPVLKEMHNYTTSPFVNDKARDEEFASSFNQDWAKPVADLWQFNAPNFQAEKKFNSHIAATAPHCSICLLFQVPNFKNVDFSITGPKFDTLCPSESHVKMPDGCFNISVESNTITSATSIMDSEGFSPLLVCYVCHVAVHASCYGVTMFPGDRSSWKCTRCCSDQFLEAECCLCNLRGGALKQTTDGRWAHLICAIVISDVTFDNIVTKEPIDVTKVSSARKKLNCIYCQHLLKKPNSQSACIQCSIGRCPLAFHVTCAYVATTPFTTGNWPDLIQIPCTRHTMKKEKTCISMSQLTDLTVNQQVIAKHKNRRYYPAVVTNAQTQEYYSVDFEDNSHCDDLLPQDIESRDCLINGSPQVGESVRVRWKDNLLYEAVYRGRSTEILYTVEFEDGSECVMKRENIFSKHEELPTRVKNRLSIATEMRHSAVFTDTSAVDGRRRTIKINYAPSVTSL